MKDITEREIEGLLRGGGLTNPVHKAALRERLLAHGTPISLEDLDKVVGGAALVAREPWKPWPEEKEVGDRK